MNKTATKKLRQVAVLTYKPPIRFNLNPIANPFKNHFRRLKRAYNRGEA